MNTSILNSVHEAAQDLHDAGLIKDTTMREFNAACLPKVKDNMPQQALSTCKKNKACQPKPSVNPPMTS